MKTPKLILKIVGAALTVAGFACLIVGFWDKLVALCPKKRPAEYDDYADVD